MLICLIDDAGFGNPDTFGGPIATPNLTRVQQAGLTYNRFHVTALCSPTRAALLTGRNHHRVGFGSIAEYPGPFPGYTAVKPKSCAALPRILSENGYVTGGFGKWHLTPDSVQGAAGPFDHWPEGWGFDHFWGFLSRRGRPVRPDHHQGQHDGRRPAGQGRQAVLLPGRSHRQGRRVAARGTSAGRGQAVDAVLLDRLQRTHRTTSANEWADRYKGKFDEGWDALREEIFARQKKLGSSRRTRS